MLKFAQGAVRGLWHANHVLIQKQGSRVQTMPEYGGTLPVVIASHGKPLPQKVGFGRIRGC